MEPKRLDLSLSLRREPVTLALLTGLAIAFFLAVTGLSRIYHAQQESLAARWSTRGQTDLDAHRYAAAVNEFRAALQYSRDSYAYQLSLAEALLGLNRRDEAHAYLINLWDRQPENGVVNLELARIAANENSTAAALRYYHNAIYATWPGDEETERNNTRLELIQYLLRIDAKTQAQAELIALEANVGGDDAEQAQLGALFLRAQDYQHALEAFRASLKINRHNQPAMAGAGVAAFQLGLYPLAQRYLEEAVAASPDDATSAAWLRQAEFVLEMDPYRQHISIEERNRIVVNAYATAGDRLKACTAPAAKAAAASYQSLQQQWTKLKPQISAYGLRRDPDLVDTAMQLVFTIERQAGSGCPAASDADKALLLIANLHEEN